MSDKIVQQTVERILIRAGEELGDITASVFELYYARHPQAHGLFAAHNAWNTVQLEGTMVEQALYCLMTWPECPGEVEIVLLTTLPHHIEVLDVSGEMFGELLTAVCDVIADTIPASADQERRCWRELQTTLLDLCARGKSFARPDLVRKPVTA